MAICTVAGRRFLVLQWSLCVAVASFSLHGGIAVGSDREKTSTVSAEAEGAKAVASIQTACRLGRPMVLSVTVRNNGDLPIVCDDYGYLPDRRLTLVNRDTKRECDLTGYGKKKFGKRGDGHGYLLLEKGMEKTWTADIGECYVLEQGNFALTAQIKLLKGEPQRSFGVSFGELLFEVSK